MKRNLLKEIIKIRLIVGYLGESSQQGWWQSSFFAPSSAQFLSPVFGKTSHLAQYHGVKEAAALVHDERIGMGASVYHLFRLPEILEQDMHRFLLDEHKNLELQDLIASPESAEQYLLEYGNAKDEKLVEGPSKIGEESSLNSNSIWKKIAGLYIQAMQSNVKVFPYFS